MKNYYGVWMLLKIHLNWTASRQTGYINADNYSNDLLSVIRCHGRARVHFPAFLRSVVYEGNEICYFNNIKILNIFDGMMSIRKSISNFWHL